MKNKKILLAMALSLAVLFSACSSDELEVTETTTAATTIAAVTTTTASETTETTTESEAGEHEQGLAFFVQPRIELYNNYDDPVLEEWEPRDTEVMRGYHYDNEWYYRKELIFAFSNYTDEPVTVDSIQIIREIDSKAISFTDGSDTLNINFTVQPKHKTDYILKAEDFDYSACESGVYTAVAKSNLDYIQMNFFIDNSELYEETFPQLWSSGEVIGIAPTFLTEEQQKVFAKAHARMQEFFWCESFMSEDYVNTHTADDFIGLFTDVFTEEYARRLAQGSYIDENGNLQAVNGGKGGNIFYCGHCFFLVSADENQVSFNAVVIHAHIDNPYEVSFEEKNYHMVNTENGWRVFDFETWY